MTACPDYDTLLAFVEDRLLANERQAISRHLRACDSCSDAVGACIEASATAPELGDQPHPVELPLGTRLDRFSILHRVGQGASGAVYAAYDPELDRRVALLEAMPLVRGPVAGLADVLGQPLDR